MTDTGRRIFRIVHYHPRIRLEDGGVVRAVLDLCAVMARRGHDVTLVTVDASGVPQEWIAGGDGLPRVIMLPKPGAFGLLGRVAMRTARDCIAAADVVHLHEVWIVSNHQWAVTCRELGKPYIASLHGMLNDWAIRHKWLKKRIYLWLFARHFLRNATAVHSTARGELRQSAKWFTNESISILPLLLDVRPYETLPRPAAAVARFPQLASAESKLLFLGRLHPVKRVELLLHAAALLKLRGTPAVCIVAGTGSTEYEARLRHLADELGLQDRAVFAGSVNGDEKLSLYQSADVFVLPSIQENFGMVLIESLACGTPVVTTRGVDIWEEIQDAGAAIAEPTAESIANAIGAVLSTPKAALGDRGRAWVMQHLKPDTVAAGYERMYEAARSNSHA